MSVYAKAEIIVSLSVYEGFGIPVLEGLYFGCKALCADIPVYRELYDKYAYFCDPADINNITSSLKIVAASENKINEIGLLLDKYDYKKSAKAIIRYIVADNSQYA